MCRLSSVLISMLPSFFPLSLSPLPLPLSPVFVRLLIPYIWRFAQSHPYRKRVVNLFISRFSFHQGQRFFLSSHVPPWNVFRKSSLSSCSLSTQCGRATLPKEFTFNNKERENKKTRSDLNLNLLIALSSSYLAFHTMTRHLSLRPLRVNTLLHCRFNVGFIYFSEGHLLRLLAFTYYRKMPDARDVHDSKSNLAVHALLKVRKGAVVVQEMQRFRLIWSGVRSKDGHYVVYQTLSPMYPLICNFHAVAYTWMHRPLHIVKGRNRRGMMSLNSTTDIFCCNRENE